MEKIIYEVKSEVDFNSEKDIAKKLNLDFIKEYKDIDYYLKSSSKNKTLKLKFLDNGKIILYNVTFDKDCFKIMGKEITKEFVEGNSR